MTPVLNWKELAALVGQYDARCRDLFVERVFVPARPRFAAGYVKGEWALKLSSRRQEIHLFFSVRPRHPYLACREGAGAKNASQATQSPFSLAAIKHLRGARLLSLETLPRERVAILWFSAGSEHAPEARLGLVLTLIPAMPEALLVLREAHGADDAEGWQVLARSRSNASEPSTQRYHPPDGSQAPADPPVCPELLDPPAFADAIERALELEAFALRRAAAEREVREALKQGRTRAKQSETAAREAEAEPDWQRFGDLLKTTLGNPPPLRPPGVRAVHDYATDSVVEVPCDPKLEPRAQVEKFFHLARRKQRRVTEARARLQSLAETVARLEALLASPPSPADWEALERLERAAGIEHAPAQAAPGPGGAKGSKHARRVGAWLGRTFVSVDGATIWVGRSRDENLELTFRHAKGNDVWMHLRGKPGAHVVIPLSSGKSASLETLLDAAQLTVFYSGGEKWGKTEVDYTFKKHVKRIRDSTEASYTQNKTLIVEPDRARLKRLLDQHAT